VALAWLPSPKKALRRGAKRAPRPDALEFTGLPLRPAARKSGGVTVLRMRREKWRGSIPARQFLARNAAVTIAVSEDEIGVQ